MAEYLPKFSPGKAITLAASAAVIGGQLVRVSGAQSVAPSENDTADWLGVAGFDAPVGESVTVYRGGVQRLAVIGAVSPGDRVAPASAGRVTVGEATNTVGTALSPATADGDVIDVAMDR